MSEFVTIQMRESGPNNVRTFEVIDRRPGTPRGERIASIHKTEKAALAAKEKLES